jgi:hypothetical protein
LSLVFAEFFQRSVNEFGIKLSKMRGTLFGSQSAQSDDLLVPIISVVKESKSKLIFLLQNHHILGLSVHFDLLDAVIIEKVEQLLVNRLQNIDFFAGFFN